ncbi:DUF742 domain-containing protein [Streptomyces sp. URMC 126]|uniref:DUF742 domain-containing protein n=1 Tax=Streptomyces sp. URMC 126 TaxID=3423401 RepID=UPI003F1D97B2
MSGPTGAGPVRPYVITGGRVAPSRDTLALETLVVAAASAGVEGDGWGAGGGDDDWDGRVGGDDWGVGDGTTYTGDAAPAEAGRAAGAGGTTVATGITEIAGTTGAAGAAGTIADATLPGEHAPDLSPECAEILDLCVRLLSVAEVAAHLRQPVAVVKVLLADLLDAGLVIARPPVTAADRHDPALLKEVLDGLRQL